MSNHAHPNLPPPPPSLARGGGLIGARLCAMMFIQYFIMGSWYVTMGPFMASKGIAADTIGTAYTLGPIAAVISPFFVGIVADRFFATERILAALHLIAGGLIFLAPTAAERSPTLFLAVILAHMLCYMPTQALTNSLSLHNITDARKHFPLIRVFGTLGWIASNWVISSFKLDVDPAMFYVAGGSAILLAIYSLSLPHTPPPSRGVTPTVRDILGLDALGLLKERSFAVFIGCSFLICVPLAAYYSFAGEFAGASGFEKIAGTMSYGQVSETLFMLVMPFFFAGLGVKWMLLVGMLAWVARYALFAAAAPDKIQWMIFVGILLHGICYDFFFVTGQIYVDQRANPAIRGQAQGLFVLVTQGLGLGLGAQIIGSIVAANSTISSAPSPTDPTQVISTTVRDWENIWINPCVTAAVIAVFFFILFREKPSAADPTNHAGHAA